MLGAAAVAALSALIPLEEGVITRVYVDPVGVLTSCMGHTGPELKLGQTFTRAQCNEQMYADLIKHTEGVLRCYPQAAWARTPYYQRVSIIDFAYNKGVGNFCGSTYRRKLIAQDPTACAEPLRWRMAAGGTIDCSIRKNNCYGVVERNQRNSRMCGGDMSHLQLDTTDFAPDGAIPEGS